MKRKIEVCETCLALPPYRAKPLNEAKMWADRYALLHFPKCEEFMVTDRSNGRKYRLSRMRKALLHAGVAHSTHQQ